MQTTNKELVSIQLVGSQFGSHTGWQGWRGFVRVDFTDLTFTTRPEEGAIFGTLAALEKEGVDVREFKRRMVRAELAGTYPPKPEHAEEYQHDGTKPVALGAWQWSSTFGRWSRLATFADGWHGVTFPVISGKACSDARGLAAAWLGERPESFRKAVGEDLAMAEAVAYFSRDDVKKF